MKNQNYRSTRLVTALCLTILASTGTSFTYAEDTGTPKPAVSTPANIAFTGAVAKVDRNDKTVVVKKGLFTKTFNLAKDCGFVLLDKKNAKLDDLQPGNRVEVTYQKSGGVLIAIQVREVETTFSGTVNNVDMEKRLVTVKGAWGNKTFQVRDDSKLVLKEKGDISLSGLKVGHKVNLTYENENGVLAVLKLEQSSLTFNGSILAIDTATHTLKAKFLLTEKKFNLAGDCKVVVDGKLGQVTDLRIGQSAEISYEDISGVLVASYIVQPPLGAPISQKTPAEPVGLEVTAQTSVDR